VEEKRAVGEAENWAKAANPIVPLKALKFPTVAIGFFNTVVSG
jgi:hypothetical protein